MIDLRRSGSRVGLCCGPPAEGQSGRIPGAWLVQGLLSLSFAWISSFLPCLALSFLSVHFPFSASRLFHCRFVSPPCRPPVLASRFSCVGFPFLVHSPCLPLKGPLHPPLGSQGLPLSIPFHSRSFWPAMTRKSLPVPPSINNGSNAEGLPNLDKLKQSDCLYNQECLTQEGLKECQFDHI